MSGLFTLYVSGLLTTLGLLASSCVLGHTLAVPIAVAAARRNLAARAYIYAIRGTPLLAQLYLVYFGLPQVEIIRNTALWTIFGNPAGCAIVTFALNTSAYTAALLASTIRATRDVEVDAARAAGMSETQLLRRIVLPSAMRRALPAYGNEVVLILHATAVAGAITVVDLTAAARQASMRTFAIIECYLAAAALYAVIVGTLILIRRAAERRWLRHLAVT